MTQDPLQPTRDLLALAQQGDRAALDSLVARYYDRVAGMVRVRLGPRLRRDLDTHDVVHEVFAAFVHKLDEFEMRDDASLVTYLATLARRRLLDASRHQHADKRGAGHAEVSLSGNDDDEGAVDPPAQITQPLDRLLRDERRDLIEACLAELPEPQRELIVLRGYAGHAFEAIAKLTSRASADAARMAYAKALVALGDKLRRRLPRTKTHTTDGLQHPR